MFPKQKRKKHFSFNIKVFNNQSTKNIKSNSINLRDIRDIFMRKQDVYLIKLLEKRIKLMKMLNSKSPNNNNKIKLMNSLPFKLRKDLNKTEKNLINKKINFKNIRIKNIKNNKTQSESIPHINFEKNENNKLDYFQDLITSKIYNKDITKNNKNMLKIIPKSKPSIYNYSYTKKNYFTIGHNKNNNSLVHLPKINKKKINQTFRKNRNIINIKNSLPNYKTIIINANNSIGGDDIILPHKLFFQDNKKIGDYFAKKILKDNYNFNFRDKSISPIKNKEFDTFLTLNNIFNSLFYSSNSINIANIYKNY